MFNTKFSKIKSSGRQKGVSLYFSIAIMAILLALALSISTILIGQVKLIKGKGDSVNAFCAADTGIEQVRMNPANPTNIPPTQLSSSPNIGYQVTVYTSSTMPSCSAPYYCIQSLGWCEQIRRAIEIAY